MKHISKIVNLLVASILLCLNNGCTKLDETLYSSVSPDQFFKNENDYKSATAGCYKKLGTITWWSYMMPIAVNSDEVCMPSRGGDWVDGGTWVNMQQHTIMPDNPWPIHVTYNDIMGCVARCNSTLAMFDQVDGSVKDVYVAEVRCLRAYFYYLLMDLYGGVPIVKSATPSINARSTRKEVFEFIEKELKEVRSTLPSTSDATWFPRCNKGVASSLLARLYLNAGVYSGTARWDDCIAQCDSVINSNKYKVRNDYYDCFKVTNKTCFDEIIFFIDLNPKDLGGGGIPWLKVTLAGPEQTKYLLPYGPWNGLAVEPHFYDKYDSADFRRYQKVPGGVNWDERGFLVGYQMAKNGIDTLKEGKVKVNHTKYYKLVMTVDEMKTEAKFSGIRPFKFEPDPNSFNGEQGNGMPLIRYTDILLMKAECLLRKGNNAPSGEVDGLVNQVRKRCFNPEKPLTNVVLNEIFDERGREFFLEGVRRTDQIRFDKWVNYGDFQTGTDTEKSKLWPIPQQSMNANPKLEQNPY